MHCYSCCIPSPLCVSRFIFRYNNYRQHLFLASLSNSPFLSSGQLILPEALKLLPVYITGALKCDAIDGGPEMMPDDKAYAQVITLSNENALDK